MLNRHDAAVQNSSDDMIQCLGTREKSGDVDYRIGRDIHVTWKGGNRYLCHHCKGDLRWQKGEHTGCVHIQRIDRFRGETFS